MPIVNPSWPPFRVCLNDHAPLTGMPYIYSSSKLRTAKMMIFSLVAMTGLEKCCITSAYLQWQCHSGERPVAREPLVCSYSLLMGGPLDIKLCFPTTSIQCSGSTAAVPQIRTVFKMVKCSECRFCGRNGSANRDLMYLYSCPLSLWVVDRPSSLGFLMMALEKLNV